MNVAPDKVVPTMPNATSIQLLLLLPMKKLSLFAPRPVAQATPSSRAKYATRMQKSKAGDIGDPKSELIARQYTSNTLPRHPLERPDARFHGLVPAHHEARAGRVEADEVGGARARFHDLAGAVLLAVVLHDLVFELVEA